jgi:hypothetical protein
LWYLQHCSFYSGLLWLLEIFCVSKWTSWLTSILVKNVIGILIRITLNIQAAFGNIVIFTILIRPIHEHKMSFHANQNDIEIPPHPSQNGYHQ